MNTKYTTQYLMKQFPYGILLGICFLLSSCEELLEVDPPIGQINTEEIFENEQTAEAAVATLYAKLRDDVLLTGRPYGQSALMGLYADELDYYSPPGEPVEAFYNHQILASNDVVKSVWSSTYQLIYQCNAVIEGVALSHSLSVENRNRLTGEALFVRGLCHFYLASLFGDVPWVTTTDYEINQNISKSIQQEVYDLIALDLVQAKSLLPQSYLSDDRARANKSVIAALLSRIYLYQQRWEDAILESSSLINQTEFFDMTTVQNEFLKDSRGTIFQLKSKNQGDNTHEAVSFNLTAPPALYSLTATLANSFEDGDLRKTHWVKQVTDGTNVWYGANKYTQTENTGTSMEYSIVFRLAEQYLIRAEAYARSGNITAALDDINTIRNRAGLLPLTTSSYEQLTEFLLTERRHELFTEHGHRWLDLLRFEKANQVMPVVKPNWKSTDALLPIPESELLLNPNLAPQNAGY